MAAMEETAMPFTAARAQMEKMIGELVGARLMTARHGALEEWLSAEGRELQRLLLQGHLDSRARAEKLHEAVMGSDGVERTHRRHRTRPLRTVVGDVDVGRMSYGSRGDTSLMPMDAELNLPGEVYSHGLRRLSAIEATRGSFEQAVDAVHRSTGVNVPKRQLEELVVRAAADFDAFYTLPAANQESADPNLLLVGSVDGKGIVMRHEDLREPTRAAAEQAETKLQTRLSKGEKTNRKRMATVASVYEVAPYVRTAEELVAALQRKEEATPLRRPRVRNKRVWARLELTTEQVIGHMLDEMQSRDPTQVRRWVIVVDGAGHQLEVIEREIRQRGLHVAIVVDLMHVLEYLWKAAWCLFAEGDAQAEGWVYEHAEALLTGDSSQVAAGIRRSATLRRLSTEQRAPMDRCADYLLRKRPYLSYGTYLADGLPLASGVIEGACRHIVRDRMDITGARWGLVRAEAVLRLRSLRSSGDFDDYWRFHLDQEHERVHLSRYANAA